MVAALGVVSDQIWLCGGRAGPWERLRVITARDPSLAHRRAASVKLKLFNDIDIVGVVFFLWFNNP